MIKGGRLGQASLLSEELICQVFHRRGRQKKGSSEEMAYERDEFGWTVWKWRWME
jgi:hypothetical protein